MDGSQDLGHARTDGRAKAALLKRLIDTVALPASLISPQDRAMAGDIVLDMLFHADDAARKLCADRLKQTVEAPRRLMRYLAQCKIELSANLLAENTSYNDSDLIDVARSCSAEHRLIIAKRKDLGCAVSDVLIELGEPHVMRALLANMGAELSEIGMDALVALSQQMEDLCALIIKRAELTPAQAMAMFWWSDGATRRLILSKHAAERAQMIDGCSDIFDMVREEQYVDPVARKAVQMIERRQRNRAALARSEFDSLEAAISAAVVTGMTPELMQEIGYLSGMKPLSTAKLMSDLGGEGLAVLCKATGLKRANLEELWRAMRRPHRIDSGEIHPQLAYVIDVFETLTVGRAQTVLRYWNWSLTAAGAQKPADQAADNDGGQEDAFSAPRRTAKLVFGS